MNALVAGHLKRRGWGLFQMFPHLTTKERPCMLTANHCPQIQIRCSIGQTITCNEAARLGSSRSVGTQHSEWQNATVGMV